MRWFRGGERSPVEREFGSQKVVVSLAAGDRDRDGDPDLVLGGEDSLEWVENRGGGSFLEGTPAVVVGPVDAVVPVSLGEPGSLDGARSPLFDLASAAPAAIVAGNLDGAGADDVVVATEDGLTAGLLSEEELVSAHVASDPARGVTVADLDGDGRPDVVAVTTAGIVWYRNGLAEGAGTGPGESDDTADPATPPAPGTEPGGCGCDGSGGAPPLLLLPLLIARVRGRR